MRRTLVLSGFLTFALAFGVTVQPAEAMGSDELNSSMSATCVGAGGSCSVVDFVLDVDGDMFMKDVAMFGNSTWVFGSVVDIWANGSTTSWNSSVSGDGLTVFAADDDATWDPEPIRIRVNMTSSGDASQLSQIVYTANGYATSSGQEGFFSTSGNVVPEPITTVLLGTGLAGLAGVGARRRKEGVEAGEDEA